jgi:hypothetical protein
MISMVNAEQGTRGPTPRSLYDDFDGATPRSSHAPCSRYGANLPSSTGPGVSPLTGDGPIEPRCSSKPPILPNGPLVPLSGLCCAVVVPRSSPILWAVRMAGALHPALAFAYAGSIVTL